MNTTPASEPLHETHWRRHKNGNLLYLAVAIAMTLLLSVDYVVKHHAFAFVDIGSDTFFQFLPLQIAEVRQLHALLELTWSFNIGLGAYMGSDFDPIYVVGHTFYVVLSPFVMWIPVMNTFSLPYKDAHFLLGHFAFDYPVTQTGDSMRVETHEQPSFPRPGNKADYTFDLKLCNPACGGSQE